MKRFLSLLLICALIGAMIPCSYAAEGKEGATRIKEEDYISADLMWDAVYAKEAELRNKKVSLSKTVDILITEVTSSPYYAEDSLIRNGDHFFWETIDGIPAATLPVWRRSGGMLFLRWDMTLPQRNRRLRPPTLRKADLPAEEMCS